MKYNISINQKSCIELGIDIIDGAVLSCIKDLLASPGIKGKEIMGLYYKWISYSLLISELPCVGISSKRRMRDRVSKLQKCGAIHVHVDARDSRVFIAAGEKFDSFSTSSPIEIQAIGVDANVQGGRTLASGGVDANVQGGRTLASTNPKTNILKLNQKSENKKIQKRPHSHSHIDAGSIKHKTDKKLSPKMPLFGDTVPVGASEGYWTIKGVDVRLLASKSRSEGVLEVGLTKAEDAAYREWRRFRNEGKYLEPEIVKQFVESKQKTGD